MKLIIAGGRDVADYTELLIGMELSGFLNRHINEIVSGCATGADTLGECFAFNHGIPVKKFPADWDTHGKSAGPIRNRQMAEYGDALLALDNGGRGTANMIKNAKQQKLEVYVHRIQKS